MSPFSCTRAPELITQLQLEPHPEGGFYREVFRSASRVTPADARGERPALTTIYYLLTAGAFSRWHRVTSDDTGTWTQGGPLELLELDPTCAVAQRALHCRQLLYCLPRGPLRLTHWQAARPLGDYALVGCTVGPGFMFADFTLLADDAAAVYGRAREVAGRLSR